MKTLLAALFAVLTIPAIAGAQTHVLSAVSLYKACTQAAPEFCNGYMAGWVQATDGSLVATPDGLFLLTIEARVTAQQAKRVFVKFIREHPEAENKPADAIVGVAMLRAGLMLPVPVAMKAPDADKSKRSL